MSFATLRSRTAALPSAVLVTALALLLAACGEPADPGERLAEAFEDTFDDSFAYRFAVDADQEALAGLGDSAGQAAAFLAGFAVTGIVDETTASADVQALGTDLLQVRSIGEDEFYLRFGAQNLLGLLGGGFAAEDLIPALDSMGFDEDLQAIVLAGLEGDWLGIEGGLDASQLGRGADAGTIDEEEARESFHEAFGEDLPEFFERYVVVEGEPDEEDDGPERYTVSLQLRELIRAAADLGDEMGADELSERDLEADLADLPATVPGIVSVEDGLVTSILFRAGETIREAGTELAGDLDLVVDLSEHGAVAEIAAPPDAVMVTPEELQTLLDRLGELAGAGFGGAPGLDG